MDHSIIFPALDEQRIDQNEGVVTIQSPFVESAHPRVQPGTQSADRRFAKTRTAQLFGDGRDFAGGYTLYHHFHQCQHESLFASLVALEDVRRKTAIACLRHLQRYRANTGEERTRPVAVAVALPFLRTFMPIRPQTLAHLRL